MRLTVRLSGPVALTAALATLAVSAPPAAYAADPPAKTPTAVGHGGAVSSVDADATAAGIEVLRKGGNAVDAAVATAAALGVTEPYSAGVGGGGYLVFYDARSGKVRTLDGRETAPRTAGADYFLEDGKPIPFAEAVTSGLSVGTPGTPATWENALRRWGTLRLGAALKPAERLADRGFTVDETFRQQTASNEKRFRAFPASRELFLPGGELPVVGSTLRNPDLADTYRELARKGTRALYAGELGEDVVRTVRKPPVDPASDLAVRKGQLTADDLRRYRALEQRPSHLDYRGLDVYGMAPSSSGGTTVGEALNILESTDVRDLSGTQYLHRFLEASRIAFADRNRWVGDPRFEDVPTRELLSQRYADSRACLISPDKALTSPLAPGDPRNPGDGCEASGKAVPENREGLSTTSLTASDKWGNVVAYTLTIESTGGSGVTVPGRGFLLNNELTDFNFIPVTPGVPDPNLPGPGKRPRSSMAPTIAVQDGKPLLAAGSPGGATIITTVLQILLGRIDRDLSLPEALAAPRASQRNAAVTQAEPGFLALPERERLEALGHAFTSTPEIGAAAALERLPDGRWLAAAEPVRRGGGSAAVTHPSPSGA
ncbi:gamma-glutamyltransferase [Streptomyces sp. A7024]|uniref:Glutathione hydrolase proenzyme n=1 Tax=Streptomyces coryli TaxID=1128680 RepID=A0A6G4TU05_9ACTN|nr:gamma-glutamyltransferase [Streptomyces coryli]NGN63030.1 gamma-glutamyltransferase [Streptomyces coryli]